MSSTLWSLGALAQNDPSAAAPANTTEENAGGHLEEVIVTAEKREASINDVGMSISAISAEQLKDQGIATVADLARVVPGFSYSPAILGPPVYLIRGVGFVDNVPEAQPSVSVYIDEVPLPYSVMANNGVALDMQRVEVLKGPQGTLFGQNSTGGAVNYIAAKPTDEFAGGADLSYDRFDMVDFSGFLSGPLSETLSARFAASTTQGGEWQRSYTRDDELGDKDISKARLLLSWQPTDALSVDVNLNGWTDKSDGVAGRVAVRRLAVNTPRAPLSLRQAILNYPLPPGDDARAADWGPDKPKNDARMYQGSVRVDYDFAQSTQLTSISSYENYSQDNTNAVDGVTLVNYHPRVAADIESYYQELRLAGSTADSKLSWLVGGNYKYDQVFSQVSVTLRESTYAYNFSTTPLGTIKPTAQHRNEQYGVFANGEYQLNDALSLQAGVRYTNTTDRFEGCTRDSGAGDLAAQMNVFASTVLPILGFPVPTVATQPGGCAVRDAFNNPTLVRDEQTEDNVSWRVNLNWQPNDDLLVYGNVSKGYKSGGFTNVAAFFVPGYTPVAQESVLGYETGIKWTPGDAFQTTAAIYYYDYQDKQLKGQLHDPNGVIPPQTVLLNVPDSNIYGGELTLAWAPIHGLTVSAAGSYVHSEVKSSFPNFDALGVPANWQGLSFPYTPKVSASLGVDYRWPVANLMAFVGSNVAYQSDAKAHFVASPAFELQAHTTVDLRAGLETEDRAWRVMLWGKNVLDEFYFTNVVTGLDMGVAFVGAPATYGITLSHRF